MILFIVLWIKPKKIVCKAKKSGINRAGIWFVVIP